MTWHCTQQGGLSRLSLTTLGLLCVWFGGLFRLVPTVSLIVETMRKKLSA